METIITNENSQKEIWRIYLKLDSSGDVRDEDDNEANKEEDQVFKNHNEHKLWNRKVKLKGKISNSLRNYLQPQDDIVVRSEVVLPAFDRKVDFG